MNPRSVDSTALRVSFALLVLAVVLYFCLSAPTLAYLGIPYDTPTGPFPAKIHPGTYVLLLAWGLGLASAGNPLATLVSQARQHRLLFSYFLCMVGVFLWAVGRHGPSGLAFLLDTLVMTGVAALTVVLQPPGRQRQLFMLLMGLLMANATLALGEAALGRRLVPQMAEQLGFVSEAYFRASALVGHPLANALLTVALLPAVLLLPWPLRWRLAAGVLVGLGLLTFGSRAALAALALFVLLACIPVLGRLLRGGFSYVQLTGGLVGAVVGAAALAGVVVATGLGERIFKNLTWDNSAQVRLRSLDVLDYFGGSDLWFGMSVSRIANVALRVGIDPRYEAIENFWIYLLLLLGVVGFVLFVVGLACLLLHIWRISRAPLRIALVVYLLMASGANTLASKTISLLMLTLAAQCAAQLRRPAPARHPTPAGRMAPRYAQQGAWR